MFFQNFQYLNLIIIVVLADFVLIQALDYINLKFQTERLPTELAGVYDQDQFVASQKYFKANAFFGFVSSSFSFSILMLALLTGFLGWLDRLVAFYVQDSIVSGLIFFFLLYLLSDLLATPFSIYKTFVIEEKFGFNKIKPGVFVIDKIKSYALVVVFGGILMYALLLLLHKSGPGFWLWFWLVFSLFILFVNMFYASLIVPLFNKLKPLEDGSLKRDIEAYSMQVEFPLKDIYVIDGSKRSSKANAFFSGLGAKKKIVLYDTLISNHSNKELVAVLAHEVGHFKKKHIHVSLFLSVLQTGFMLWLLSKFVFNSELSYALGASQLSLPLNLIAFGILYTPISHLTGMAMNIVSRRNEFEADTFAASTYDSTALQDALKKLSSNNLSNLTAHPVYVFFHYSHPPLLQRLQNLKRFKL